MQLSEVASSITNKQIVPSFQQLDQRKTAQLPSISRNHLKLRPAEAKKKKEHPSPTNTCLARRDAYPQ